MYVVQTDSQTIVSNSPIPESELQSNGFDLDEFAFIESGSPPKTPQTIIPNAECANPYKRKPALKPDTSQPIRQARLPPTNGHRATPPQPQSRSNVDTTFK